MNTMPAWWHGRRLCWNGKKIELGQNEASTGKKKEAGTMIALKKIRFSKNFKKKSKVLIFE